MWGGGRAAFQRAAKPLLYACRPHSCTPRILSKFPHKGILARRGQGREWGQLRPTSSLPEDLSGERKERRDVSLAGMSCPRVLGRSPPNAPPDMVGPCQSTGAPQSLAGLPPAPGRARSTCQHKHTSTHHFPSSILFPPPTLAVEAKCCLALPCGSGKLFRPQQAQPQKPVGAAHFSDTKIAAIIRSTTVEPLAPAQPEPAGPAAPPVNPLEAGPGGLPADG